jgi:hypothetical protein
MTATQYICFHCFVVSSLQLYPGILLNTRLHANQSTPRQTENGIVLKEVKSPVSSWCQDIKLVLDISWFSIYCEVDVGFHSIEQKYFYDHARHLKINISSVFKWGLYDPFRKMLSLAAVRLENTQDLHIDGCRWTRLQSPPIVSV